MLLSLPFYLTQQHLVIYVIAFKLSLFCFWREKKNVNWSSCLQTSTTASQNRITFSLPLQFWEGETGLAVFWIYSEITFVWEMIAKVFSFFLFSFFFFGTLGTSVFSLQVYFSLLLWFLNFICNYFFPKGVLMCVCYWTEKMCASWL